MTQRNCSAAKQLDMTEDKLSVRAVSESAVGTKPIVYEDPEPEAPQPVRVVITYSAAGDSCAAAIQGDGTSAVCYPV